MNLSPPTPPIRAEHIGSLLRPDELLDARTQIQGDWKRPVSDSLYVDELQSLEDECIRRVVSMQEELGYEAVTDGEFRRRTWWQNFISAMAGTSIRIGSHKAEFDDASGGSHDMPVPYVDGPIRRIQPIALNEFRFLRQVTVATPKLTLPSPPILHFFGGRDAIDEDTYPNLEDFWTDVIKAYREEIDDLSDEGCTYLQLDETNLACLCDTKVQNQFRQRGEDPEIIARKYADVINASLASRPSSMTVGMHLCRGNSRGRWLAEGGYDFVADIIFNEVTVDTYFLEYDTDRAGDFSPLRLVPEDKVVVLGLISTKTPALESVDEIKRRIDDAARYVPYERLALSPQCGFASTYLGNPVTMDDQRRKLELVKRIADEVWH